MQRLRVVLSSVRIAGSKKRATVALASTNRRERFRDYMSRLTTGLSAEDAIAKELYVPLTAGALPDRLVPRLDLQPASAHLVVGGVGTGKTTQMLVATERLSQLPDVFAAYIDVSKHHDLLRLTPGVMTVLAGLSLSERLNDIDSEVEKNQRRRFRRWARGYTEWIEEQDYPDTPDDGHDGPPLAPVYHQPVLVPSEPPLNTALKEKTDALGKLHAALTNHLKHVVLLFDSLDRMTDMASFSATVNQDIRAIKQLGIGVVVVGPLTSIFGSNRQIADMFDHTYHVPAVDVDAAEGPELLERVLRLRVPEELLTDGAVRKIVHSSGGVFRDLLSIARAAGEEAYIVGADKVLNVHAALAADNFGRSLMLGLGADEIAVLQRVKSRGQFIQTSDKHIALLATRRVLEYGEGDARFKVHPTIAGLIDQIPTK